MSMKKINEDNATHHVKPHLGMLVHFPDRVAGIVAAQIDVFHIDVVITDVNYFARNPLLVGGTFGVWTQDVVNAWQGGVQFGVLVDDVAKGLLRLFQLGARHTHVFGGQGGVLVATLATVIHQLVLVVRIDADIIHVRTDGTEVHGSCSIRLHIYLGVFFNFLLFECTCA